MLEVPGSQVMTPNEMINGASLIVCISPLALCISPLTSCTTVDDVSDVYYMLVNERAHTRPKKFTLEKVDPEWLLSVTAQIEVSRPARKMWAEEQHIREWFKHYAKSTTVAAAVEKANTGELKKIVGHFMREGALKVSYKNDYVGRYHSIPWADAAPEEMVRAYMLANKDFAKHVDYQLPPSPVVPKVNDKAQREVAGLKKQMLKQETELKKAKREVQKANVKAKREVQKANAKVEREVQKANEKARREVQKANEKAQRFKKQEIESQKKEMERMQGEIESQKAEIDSQKKEIGLQQKEIEALKYALERKVDSPRPRLSVSQRSPDYHARRYSASPSPSPSPGGDLRAWQDFQRFREYERRSSQGNGRRHSSEGKRRRHS
eukprot:COSAG01_NODE_11132_length_1999_cov_19.840526_1_plen_380_part_00